MKTRQELFTNAYLGFASQGWRRSVEETSYGCVYRGPDGSRCAIGWNIDDADYDPAMENCSVYCPTQEGWTADAIIKSKAIALVAGVQEADWAFAADLQKIHDQCGADHPAFEERYLKTAMEEFAIAHNLAIPDLPLPKALTDLLNAQPADVYINA